MYKNCPISECGRRNAPSRYTDFRNTHENRKKNKDWKIRRKEWSKCERKKRERERGGGHWADRTGIRAARALPGEDVQGLCPRARRIRVTGTFPASHPRGLPCFILVYHAVMRSLPHCLFRRSRPTFFLPFGFNRNVMSVVRRAWRRKSA